MAEREWRDFQLTTLSGVFCLLLLIVFAAEVSVMQYHAGRMETLGIWRMALIDAATLVPLIGLPLWFFIFNPALRDKIRTQHSYVYILLKLYAKVLVCLFFIQILTILLLTHYRTAVSDMTAYQIDGLLTAILSAPLFWWMLCRLEMNYRIEPLADFIHAPMTLYGLLLFLIFLADYLQEILLPHFVTGFDSYIYQMVDPLFSVVLIAPLLLALVVVPLRRMARSEQIRTQTLYDQVDQAIVKVDAEGQILSCNRAAEKIFGSQSQALIGHSADQLVDAGQLDVLSILRNLGQTQTSKPQEFHNLSATQANGNTLIFDLSIMKIPVYGPDEYQLMLRDITRSKATEDELAATDTIFREIFNQTEDAILFFQPGSHRLLDLNTTTETLFHCRRTDLLSTGIRPLFSGAMMEKIENVLQEIEKEGQAQAELHCDFSDNQLLVVSLRGKMINLQTRPVLFCTLRNISERIQLENEAREIQSKLIYTNKMTSLGMLVSCVAHEINNPNNYVLTNAQMLSGVWKDARYVLGEYYEENGDFLLAGIPYSQFKNAAPEIFRAMTDGSRRINAIITDLKRFVRQDSTNPLTQSVQLNEVATSAASMLHFEIMRHTDHFSQELAEDLPIIHGSAQQLGQVVVNLLMNACQALPNKGCAVWLQTRYNQETQQVILSVRDQGPGLAKEIQDHLFEPFFTTRIDSGGTGLGLSICKTIVKDHGGDLVFTSESGKGATFSVLLPVPENNFGEETG